MTQTSQQIPGGWRKVGLTDISQIRKGLTYKSTDYGSENDGITFVTLKCIAKGGGFNQEGIKFYKGKYDRSNTVRAGDLIIANTDLTRAGDIIGAPLFMPPVNDYSVLISMDLSAINIDEDQITKKFLYYYLLQDRVRQFMRSISSGSTVLHLHLKSLKDFQIYLPPLVEQVQIAAILSKVDEEIEKVERIIEQTENLKKGLMQRFLTKGIGHTKFKKTELGEIPEEWEVIRLEEVCKFITDGKHGDCRDEENSGYYFVSVKDIFDGKIHYENARQITKEDFLEVNKRTQLEPKDLLITNSGTIARIAIASDDEKTQKTTFQKSVAIIKPMHNLVSVIFLSYVLQILKDRLVINSSGSAQKNLLLKDLRAAKIFFPHIVEQNTIASVLLKIENKISINQKIRSHFLKLKKGLMNDLLSGRKHTI